MTTLSRRSFLRTTALAAGTPALMGAPNGNRPPNVVLIISDDQHWGDYGFMGHPHIRTPRLDRLASESVVFTRGYVTAALCCPSLGSMITGLHPHQNKITTNDPNMSAASTGKRYASQTYLSQREATNAFYRQVPTLPRLLATKGYVSHQSGKWWGGHYSNGGFTDGMTHGDPARGGRHGDAGLDIGRRTMQPVFSFMDKARTDKQPFFVWYAPFLPHSPHTPPERLLQHYRDKTPSLHIAKYWAMCEWFDETCGQLLDHLDEKGLRDNTIVLYVCDNGWIQRPDSPAFAPRSKRSRYDGGSRTPVMLRWPGHMQPRRDDQTPVSSVDLAPTVLSACGLPRTEQMQGTNLLDTDALVKRNTVFGATYEHDARDINKPEAQLLYRWCVHGNWKLIAPHLPNTPKGTAELYDLSRDPNEENNQAVKHPEIVVDLWDRIQKWWPIEGQRKPRLP